MKKSMFFFLVSFQLSAFGATSLYPPSFSWQKYVSKVNDQIRQGTCTTFAAVGGVESMYNLYFGLPQKDLLSLDLSERFAYAGTGSYGGSIDQTLIFARDTGLVTAACEPYPLVESIIQPIGYKIEASENISEGRDFYKGTQIRIVGKTYDGGPARFQLACPDKKRFRPNYENVSSELLYGDDERVKYLLVNRGPIMMHFYEPSMHFTDHAYVLHGWYTNSTGKTVWLYRDSWPNSISMARPSTVSPAQIFKTPNVVTTPTAYIITDVTEERNSNGIWIYATPQHQPFELEPENQLVTINKPNSCDNQGTYTLSNFERLDGANVYNWSIRATDLGTLKIEQRYQTKYLSVGILTGEGKGVTVVATIRRSNGLLENVTQAVGDVGSGLPPITLNQTWNCASKSVFLSVKNPFPNGSLSVPAGPNYSVIPNNKDSLTIRFAAPAGPSAYYTISGTAGCPARTGRIANIAPLCN